MRLVPVDPAFFCAGPAHNARCVERASRGALGYISGEQGGQPEGRPANSMKCPICGKRTTAARDPEFPFCSERCRLLDLGNWASERYVISEPALEEPAGRDTSDERTGYDPGSGDK